MSDLLLELAHFAENIADQTRQTLKQERQRYLYQGRDFETKEDASPVTEIDQQIERLIRRLIQQHYPEHGILGEEYGAEHQQKEWVWVIDPIDGTKQFIAGTPIFGTLISVCHFGTPVIGIIDIPSVDERWLGIAGYPSTLNGHVIHTRRCSNLSAALMSTSNPEPVLAEHRQGYEALIKESKWRIYGMACYAYGCLAAGKIDLSVDSGGMREVDYCAMVPIIEGAGGKITDWNGEPLTLHSESTVVAAGDPRLHAQVLQRLQQLKIK